MNLYRGRGRVLHETEEELAFSDPHLAALFRMFTSRADGKRLGRGRVHCRSAHELTK